MNALGSLYEKKSDTEVPSYFLGSLNMSGLLKTMLGGAKNITASAVNNSIMSQIEENDKKMEEEALARAAAEMDAYTNRQSLLSNPNLPDAKPNYYIDSLEDQARSVFGYESRQGSVPY